MSPLSSVVPRSIVSMDTAVRIRHAFAKLAGGRVLIIDDFASARCGVAWGPHGASSGRVAWRWIL